MKKVDWNFNFKKMKLSSCQKTKWNGNEIKIGHERMNDDWNDYITIPHIRCFWKEIDWIKWSIRRIVGRCRRHSHLTIIDKSYHSIRNSLFVVVGVNQKRKENWNENCLFPVFILLLFRILIGSCFFQGKNHKNQT